MAWVVRTYACGADDCGKQFELFQDRDEGPPRFCPKCGAEFDEDAEPIPSRIAIGGSAIAKATDGTYRQLEESSAARAAELDAPALKITDLKDNLRVGDVAAKTPDNTVTRFARGTKDALGIDYLNWGGGMGGARVAPAIPSGTPGATFAGPGHIALAGAQTAHGQRVEEAMASTRFKPAIEQPEPQKYRLPRER